MSELAADTGLSTTRILFVLWKFLPEQTSEGFNAFASNLRQILLSGVEGTDYEGIRGHESETREAMAFVHQHVDRFYCIAFIGTSGDPEAAEDITVVAMKRVMVALRQVNLKQFSREGVWEWVSGFVVDAVVEWHSQYSQAPSGPITDPSVDGSSQMDWETTVILGAQRVKRYISTLPEEQKKVFILRHQLNLGFCQVAAVLNEHEDNVRMWLNRARVQLVKCLAADCNDSDIDGSNLIQIFMRL